MSDTDIDTPDWPEIIRALQAQVQSRIHTALPAVIKSYDSSTQTATVELAVQLKGSKVPPLADVPVCWPGGAQGFLHIPLEAGDTCMVVFAEEDFSKWWESGSVSAPAVLERHGLHAMAIPGLRRAAMPQVTGDGRVTLAATDELRLGSDGATQYVALASLVAAQLTALKSAISGAAVVAGDGGAAFKTNLIAALSSWPATVAATKVKAT